MAKTIGMEAHVSLIPDPRLRQVHLDVTFTTFVKPEVVAILGVESAEDLLSDVLNQVNAQLRRSVQIHFSNWELDEFYGTEVMRSMRKREVYAKTRVIVHKSWEEPLWEPGLREFFTENIAPRINAILSNPQNC